MYIHLPVQVEVWSAAVQKTSVLLALSHAVVSVAGNNINLNAPFLQSGAQAVRIIDPTNKTSTLIGMLDRTRLGVTLTTMGDGNILIMGGNQQVCLHLS